jgi:cardiolipin-specific phospholipase
MLAARLTTTVAFARPLRLFPCVRGGRPAPFSSLSSSSRSVSTATPSPSSSSSPSSRRGRTAFARLVAGAGAAAASFEALSRSAGLDPRTWGSARPTPAECARASDALLRSSVSTPFTSYHRAGLYTVEMQAPDEDAPVLVLLPGYGSGSGMWLLNLDELARHYKVFAVDWKGSGASERPDWGGMAGGTGGTQKSSSVCGAKGQQQSQQQPRSVKDGERWFTDSLEEWRAQTPGASSAVLVGHSLGGYLSAAYALRHPHRVDHLVLVSPAGIPTPPEPEVLAQRRAHWLMGLLSWAWESGVTPQGLIRSLGPWGERWAGDIVSRRFAHVFGDHKRKVDRALLTRYLYCITAADGSGEHALRVLLSFGGHAREPMGPRLVRAASVGEVPDDVRGPGGGGGGLAGSGGRPLGPHKLSCPVTFVYGSHDWMPAPAGAATATALRAQGVDAWSGVLGLPSGHHLYLEAPELFNRTVLWRLQGTAREVRERRRKGEGEGQGGGGEAAARMGWA